jgi:hypothetical protein
MKTIRTISCILAAAIFLAGGCSRPKPTPNPLIGWKLSWSQDPNKLDKKIRDDYEHYIQGLPPNEKKHVGPIQLLEDGLARIFHN